MWKKPSMGADIALLWPTHIAVTLVLRKQAPTHSLESEPRPVKPELTWLLNDLIISLASNSFLSIIA